MENKGMNMDGFLKYLKGPMLMAWDITNRCNMNCKHCLNRSNDSDIHSYNDELTEQEIEDVIEQIIEIKPFAICICGGEPTLSPNLFKIIRSISSAGIDVNMVSNGYVINKEFARNLKEAGLKFIQISLDGINAETHDSFRKTPQAFDRAINAIKNLIDSGLSVATSFCPNKSNINQFDKYVDFIAGLGCSEVRVMPIMPMGRAFDEFEKLEPSPQEYLKLANIVAKKKVQYSQSVFVIEFGDPLEHIYIATHGGRKEAISMEIKSNGDIGVSPYLPITVGNVKNHKLQEYWNNGYNKIWGHPIVDNIAKKINTLEDFKEISLRTWSIERKAFDLLEEDVVCK